MKPTKAFRPSEVLANEEPTASVDSPEATTEPRDYVVRFTPPTGEPVAYVARAMNIEQARASFSLTVTEQLPGQTLRGKQPRWKVEVASKKTETQSARRITIPVYAADANAAIEEAKRLAVSNFMFPVGSLVEVKCGDVAWKARVTEAAGG